MWNHNSHSNHSSPAGGQQQSTVTNGPGSSPCISRLQERFDVYRNHSNDQEKKYETTFKIMNGKSIDETNRMREQHLITVNSTNNKPTGSRKQSGANKNGSNGSNKRSNPDKGDGGQRCVKNVKQEEDSTNKVAVSVKAPKLAKITPKVVKVEPNDIKEESPLLSAKPEPGFCPLVAPQNGLLMTQSDHFSLEGLTDNVAIGEEELLKLYEELGGTIAPNNLMMMSHQQPIINTVHQQSSVNYTPPVINGRPQFVNSQPPQQQQIYQRFPPQVNRPPQFQQQFSDQQQSRFNVQPQMNGPPQLNGPSQLNGQNQMNGQPQINGQSQLNGQSQMNGQPHFNGQQPQLTVQQLPSNCIQRDTQQQHHQTSQGHHVHVQSNVPRQHFDGQQQSHQQQFNGQQQVHHQFNGQQQPQQFNSPQQHHVQQHLQQNGQQFQQQQQSWYQYQQQGFQ